MPGGQKEGPKIPDTPPALRGQAYSTHLYARCPEFKACGRCFMCQNFSRHNPLCAVCEGSKPNMRHHGCSVDQVDAILQLQERLNRPMYDPNAEAKHVTSSIMSTATDENAHLVRGLTAEEF